MRVKIKENAYSIYIDNFPKTEYWEKIFKGIQGKTLDVDTDVLFKYEFNIKPYPPVFDEEIRIEIDMIDEILEDERDGLAYCYYCHENSKDHETCTNCGNKDFLEPLIEE